MAYEPTFSVNAIGRDEPAALEIGIESMGYLLDALVKVDESHLRRFWRQTPRMYNSGVRYDTLDPPEGSACGDDLWADIPSILNTTAQPGHPNAGKPLADCFPRGTLLLRDDYELIPVEDIKVGDRIWGRDAWTTVEAKTYNGVLSIDALLMNNGSIVKLTGNHHVFVAKCSKHVNTVEGRECSCPLTERETVRVGLRDVQKNDVLVGPEKISFGKHSMDLGKAYVEGLYVSDGSSQNSRFFICGKDGKRKEEQKREVQTICERLGLHTRWDSSLIAVNDAEWTLRMHQMGRYAPDKHVLSLDLQEDTLAETLRGVMADSSANASASRGRTFATTSRKLATQLRVMQRMFGRSTSSAYIENRSGSFGDLPIWHIGVRDPAVRAGKLLRAKKLMTDVTEAQCYDIQTSDHYVYLPEHDVTVSNCEDLSAWRASEANVVYRVGESAPPVRCDCCHGTGLVFRRVEPYVFLRRDYVRDEYGEKRRRHLYHVVVRWPEGLPNYPNTVKRTSDGLLIEDPSRILGM